MIPWMRFNPSWSQNTRKRRLQHNKVYSKGAPTKRSRRHINATTPVTPTAEGDERMSPGGDDDGAGINHGAGINNGTGVGNDHATGDDENRRSRR